MANCHRVDAAEIRIRAERRIGELMREQKDAGLVAKGGQPHQKDSTGSKKNPVAPITLAEVGIDKGLADRARKYAAVPAVSGDTNGGGISLNFRRGLGMMPFPKASVGAFRCRP